MDHPVAVPQVWWWVYSGDMEGDLVIKVCPRGGVNSLITRSNPHYYPTWVGWGITLIPALSMVLLYLWHVIKTYFFGEGSSAILE